MNSIADLGFKFMSPFGSVWATFLCICADRFIQLLLDIPSEWSDTYIIGVNHHRPDVHYWKLFSSMMCAFLRNTFWNLRAGLFLSIMYDNIVQHLHIFLERYDKIWRYEITGLTSFEKLCVNIWTHGLHFFFIQLSSEWDIMIFLMW